MTAQKHILQGAPGEHISVSVKNAMKAMTVRQAVAVGKHGPEALIAIEYVLEFNGIEIPLPTYLRIDELQNVYAVQNLEAPEPPAELVAQVVNTYMVKSHERAEAYRNSPEGRAAAAEAEARRQAAQVKVNHLIAQLPEVVTGPVPALLSWAAEFTESADHVGVEYDGDKLAEQLTSAGYVKGEFVGDQYREQLQTDLMARSRYFIGQVLDLMVHKRGFPSFVPDSLRDLATQMRSVPAASAV